MFYFMTCFGHGRTLFARNFPQIDFTKIDGIAAILLPLTFYSLSPTIQIVNPPAESASQSDMHGLAANAGTTVLPKAACTGKKRRLKNGTFTSDDAEKNAGNSTRATGQARPDLRTHCAVRIYRLNYFCNFIYHVAVFHDRHDNLFDYRNIERKIGANVQE